ncbi:ATP-binding protein [Myxococcota bacterium]|nr:ATP-binding protein [Myxococcota bacterium]
MTSAAPALLPPEAAPVKGVDGCPLCGGRGYRVVPGDTYARAERCTCVPTCPRCGGLGRVTVERDGALLTGRCRCQQLPDRIQHWGFAQVPSRHARATLPSFIAGAMQHGDREKMKALLEGVQPWIEGWRPQAGESTGPRGLVLHGPVGRGKTHLLVGILRELVFERGAIARFVEFSRLLGMLKEGYSRGQGDSELLTELSEVPVLAIDELGKGRLTDWELAIIDEIISRRYNAMRCTLATTNYEPKEATGVRDVNLAVVDGARQSLGDRVGDRVFSRLREMCGFVWVGGIDMRPVVSGGATAQRSGG